jgi:hypothetical protein
MSGQGGHKHRVRALRGKRERHRQKAKANIASVRGIFESKGQAWDPQSNPAQMAALSHDARRWIASSATAGF